MNILLTNDDGYQSVGLQQMTRALSMIDGVNVYVVAPDGQRSAFAHAISFYKPITYIPLEEYHGAVEAYISSGTPANCANYGLAMLGVKFDLVISGPNNGPNYGYDILYSGTVAAAEEAYLKGVRGVAISRSGHSGEYDGCTKFVVENLDKLYSFCEKDAFLNVNVPNVAIDQIQGVVVTKQSDYTLYDDYYRKVDEHTYSLEGDPVGAPAVDDDISWVHKGYITITPLSTIKTSFQYMDKVKKLFQL